MRIDAHQHFWNYDAKSPEFDWITPEMATIRRSFAPPDLKLELEAHAVAASVAVQAAQSEAETSYLLGLAAEHDWIAGVVGWVDLCDPAVGAVLDRWGAQRKFRGVRRIVQAEPEAILSEPSFRSGVRELGKRGLTYDVLVKESQLGAVLDFAAALDDQRLVIDHIAKPRILEGELQPWAERMQALGKLDHVYCKVSGIITEAHWSQWTEAELAPYLDVVFESFPPKRLMFGSDWPVCLVAGSYGRVLQIVEGRLASLDDSDRRAVLGETANEFYSLGLSLGTSPA